MTANDVDGWDSLSHVNLILAVEKGFGIRFTRKEIMSFKNVGELLRCIDSKCSGRLSRVRFCVSSPRHVGVRHRERRSSVPSAYQAIATFRQSVVKLNWRSWDHRSFLLYAGLLTGFLAQGGVAAGADSAISSTLAHSSEITAYCNVVISNGGRRLCRHLERGG